MMKYSECIYKKKANPLKISRTTIICLNKQVNVFAFFYPATANY